MKRTLRELLLSALAVACLAISWNHGPASYANSATGANATECLQLGWKTDKGTWYYNHATIDSYDEHGRIHIRFDYNHGQLEMRVEEKDSGGRDTIDMRGKWFEGPRRETWGHVFLKMEKGSHHAQGWYTLGDNETNKYELVLRDCQH